jgi:hypothetical protein
MRTFTLALLLLALSASPAWAEGSKGGGGNNRKLTTLRVVNQCDGAVVVSFPNPDSAVTLEYQQSQDYRFFIASGKKLDETLTATLVGTSISASKTITLQGGKDVTATVTCPTSSTLDITVTGGLASLLNRESGVMLASTGALLPLLWLGFLLGRQPSRKPLEEARNESSGIADAT